MEKEWKEVSKAWKYLEVLIITACVCVLSQFGHLPIKGFFLNIGKGDHKILWSSLDF